MSAKKGRRAKPQQRETQKAPAAVAMDPNLSAIERASFMEGLQQNFGNPLHSTAMEEDLNVLENQKKEDGKTVGKQPPKTSEALVKQSGNVVKRKNVKKDAESEVEEGKKKRSRRGTGGTVKAGPEKEAETKKKKEGAPQRQRKKSNTDKEESHTGDILKTAAASGVKQQVTKKPAAVTRKVKKQNVKKDGNGGSKVGGGKSNNPEPQEDSDADSVQQRQRRVLPSDEDVTDDDTSWNPSQKEAQSKRNSSGRKRGSLPKSSKSGTPSTESSSEEPDEDDRNQQKRKKGGSRSATELEVVLDAFTDFCDQYRESVESKAVKQSIKSFASVVKQQLMEKISSQKELKVLKRGNAKVASLIRKKTQRLLDAKFEMMRVERQITSLKKEESKLKRRLADLKQGQAFLHDLRELNRLYLDFRTKHPKKKETYGASSLPALQLETKQIKEVEQKHGRKSNQQRKIHKTLGAKN